MLGRETLHRVIRRRVIGTSGTLKTASVVGSPPQSSRRQSTRKITAVILRWATKHSPVTAVEIAFVLRPAQHFVIWHSPLNPRAFRQLKLRPAICPLSDTVGVRRDGRLKHRSCKCGMQVNVISDSNALCQSQPASHWLPRRCVPPNPSV